MMENNLPNSWIECKFGQVAKIYNGYAFATKDFRRDNGIPLIKQSQLNGDKVDLTKCVFLEESFLKSKKEFVLKKGDVLIGMSGSVGKMCLYDLDSPALQNQRTGKAVPLSESNLNKKLFWYFLSTIERVLLEKGKGLGVANVSATDIEDLTFNLPPLNEQHRIVAKLDAVMQKVESNKERLEKIPKILKRFRQSVLAAAVSGRLTEDWRKKNGVIEEWRENKLGSIITLITSGSRGWAKYYSEQGSLFVRAQNISKDVLDLSEIAFVKLPNATEGVRTLIKQNDILITITGANVTKTAHVDIDIKDAYVSQHVGLVRVKKTFDSKFIYLFLISESNGRKQLLASAYGQGKPQLNLDNIKEVEIQIPTREEQQEIVRQVEKLFAIADKLEARYVKAKAMLDKLPQSILAKAFRGELVPQDPNDEPASVLLERIKKEKEGEKKRKK
jgi:type I restriction enzyme, S subunit